MAIHEDEKLSKFLLAINAYAENQRSKIMDEVEEHNHEELKKAEHDVLSESYTMIQNEISELQSDIRRKISTAETDERNSLIQERTKIENKVFDEVVRKLTEFSHFEQYKDLLCKDAQEIKDSLNCGNDGEELTVYVKDDDLKFTDDLKSIFGSKCEVTADNSIKVGGLRVFSKNQSVIADMTFDSALGDKHEWFAENSGLSVSIR